MLFFLAPLAAGSLPTLVLGVPLSSVYPSSDPAVPYTQYTGPGASPPWPAESSWFSFDALFAENLVIIKGSCSQFGATNPSDVEISDLRNAISLVTMESGVPAAFIFATVMQESNGCVRAPTTNYGVRNPGLMQAHNGDASCNDGYEIVPCPAFTIAQMIRDGTRGTPSGNGLAQLISSTGDTTVSRFYKAARMYNSGSIAPSGNLEDGIATHCYASDVANRLIGWSAAPHECDLDSVDVPVTTDLPDSSSSTAPIAPGVSTDCRRLHEVRDGDNCFTLSQTFGFTFAQFQQWNSQINAQCNNLWKGYQYCVSG